MLDLGFLAAGRRRRRCRVASHRRWLGCERAPAAPAARGGGAGRQAARRAAGEGAVYMSRLATTEAGRYGESGGRRSGGWWVGLRLGIIAGVKVLVTGGTGLVGSHTAAAIA